tara:strand:+ start:394 stop:915 length:522 start_codon:yes stop_codon:yes gene_type:complete
MEYSKLEDNNIDFSDHEDGVWFGDPCYVVPEDQWASFCNAMFDYEKKADVGNYYIGEVHDEATGIGWYCWSTAYGDGCYSLEVDGNTVAELGVDAGLLSAIPMTLVNKWCKDPDSHRTDPSLGHVLPADICNGYLATSEGDMHFRGGTGPLIAIPTGDSCDDDYDPYEDEEES